jgi:hypothetical protein
VPHLETVLLLAKEPSKTWTGEEIAARLYIGVDAARAILQDLVRLQLAMVRPDGTGWCYDGRWDPTGEEMTAVERTYRQQLVPVASLIHSKGSAALRDFARAFDLKKDPK